MLTQSIQLILCSILIVIFAYYAQQNRRLSIIALLHDDNNTHMFADMRGSIFITCASLLLGWTLGNLVLMFGASEVMLNITDSWKQAIRITCVVMGLIGYAINIRYYKHPRLKYYGSIFCIAVGLTVNLLIYL